jgi:hypothetical protein
LSDKGDGFSIHVPRGGYGDANYNGSGAGTIEPIASTANYVGDFLESEEYDLSERPPPPQSALILATELGEITYLSSEELEVSVYQNYGCSISCVFRASMHKQSVLNALFDSLNGSKRFSVWLSVNDKNFATKSKMMGHNFKVNSISYTGDVYTVCMESLY